MPASGGKDPFVIKAVAGANPAAGAEASDAVPSNKRWKVHAHSIPLVTDGTVISRISSLVMDDGVRTNRRLLIPGPSQAASLTRTHMWPEGYDNSAQGVVTMFDTETVLMVPRMPIGGVELPPGARLRTATQNLQAGDDYGATVIWVKEEPL